MKKYDVDLIKNMGNLCDIYKRYIDINSGSRLSVLMQNNTITFKLFNDDKLLDEFSINFSVKEEDIYTYLSVVIIQLLLDKNKVFNGDNVFCNNLNNPSIKVEVLDNSVFDALIVLMASRDPNKLFDMLRDNLVWRLYPRKFMNNLNERISFSKKLLRME